jgi:hypothetical protein
MNNIVFLCWYDEYLDVANREPIGWLPTTNGGLPVLFCSAKAF